MHFVDAKGILYQMEDCFRYVNEFEEKYEQMSFV